MLFVPFTENNEWEGEEWTFWLQLGGNSEELAEFMGYLIVGQNDDCEFPYDIDMNTAESEEVVDKLVQHAQVGYMSNHNKVVGRFTCPQSTGEQFDRDLNKGGIRKHFKV